MRNQTRPFVVRPVLLLLLLLAALAGCNRFVSSPGNQPAPSPPAPSPSPACALPFGGNFANDFAGVMNADSRDLLELKLDGLKKSVRIDFAVVTLKTTGDQPIADYSLSLARCWNLGSENPDGAALLLMVAVDDRKWHMQVSRNIEKILSNEQIQEAGRLMTARLKVGEYSEGLHECVDETIRNLLARRRSSTNTNNR